MSYTYDVSDRLVGVVYGTATTVLQYDLGGRKLAMDDPDMGDWSYTYDALGNLLSQADGRGCTTTLTYDLINRPENKSYSGSCGVSTAAVAYTYDQGSNGIGRRTRLDDGSGYTTWSYNARGRVEYETQVISGSGTFLTQYAYNWLERIDEALHYYAGGQRVAMREGSSTLYFLLGDYLGSTARECWVSG